MASLLVADASECVQMVISDLLKDSFEIHFCSDGDQVMRDVRSYQPDILLIDCMLPGIDALTVIHTIRSASMNTGIIALTSHYDEVVAKQLASLRVYRVFRKPCRLFSVASAIRELYVMQVSGNDTTWCVENEIDRTLLSLGFCMGPKRYKCVHFAVLNMFVHNSSMKELYIDVARRCGGTRGRVEKAIRDAVEAAYNCGNADIWRLLFNHYDKGHPSNEEFISRIAGAVASHARLTEGVTLDECSQKESAVIEK